jgi:hypothetical protein
MALMYEVTGYDRKTGELVAAHDVPGHCLGSALRVAGVSAPDPDLGSYPLATGQVNEISALIGAPIYRPDLDFFLEPYDALQQAAK